MSVKSSCTFAFYCLYFKLLFYYSIWYSKQTSKTRHGDAINKKQSRVPTAITFVQHCICRRAHRNLGNETIARIFGMGLI